MTCAACRFAGAPEPRVREGLHAARHALWSVDASRRQLGWAQHRIGAGAKSGGGLGCLFAVIFVPFAGCGGLFFAGARTGDASDVGVAALFLGPAVFMLIVGLGIVEALKKTRQKLEQACTAVPPAVPGAPPGCHVCGADLPEADLTRQSVIRCRYCHADNVVRQDLLRFAAGLGVQATHSLIAQVQEHALALVKHRKRSSVLLAALALLAPFAGCVGFGGVALLAPDVEPTAEYILLKTEQGACVARDEGKRKDGTRTFKLGQRSPLWIPDGSVVIPKGELSTFRAGKLVGHEAKSSARKGRVTRAVRNAFVGLEHVYLNDKPEISLNPEELCFDEAPDGLEILETFEIDTPKKPSASTSASAPKPSASP